jgi:hypothetical protein
MKKVLVLLVVALFMVGLSNAQPTKLKFGVGPYIGLPLGTFSDITSVGFGGLVQGELDLAPQWVGTASVGYLSFSGKTVSGFSYGNWSIVPVWVGGKYFFTPNVYGAAQIGLNFISYTQHVSFFGFNSDVSVSDTKFGFNVGVGYDLGQWDFLVRYSSFMSDASAISLTAMYKFTL